MGLLRVAQPGLFLFRFCIFNITRQAAWQRGGWGAEHNPAALLTNLVKASYTQTHTHTHAAERTTNVN